MILNQISEVLYFTFPMLSAFKEIRHGIFCRTGGVSRGDFAGLNVSFGVGDDPACVRQNREAMRSGIGGDRAVFLHQIHQTDVVVIGADSLKSEQLSEPRQLTGDALVTSVAGIDIGIQAADCQTILIYDPASSVVGAVHAGWKGSIDNIIGRCIHIMTRQMGCDPQKMVAGISPSLGPCCAEFIHYQKEIPPAFWPYKDDRDHFDFWAVSRDQLIAAGLASQHIETAGICTRCNPHLFFSFRRQRRTGRFATVIGLK
jgi:polyphenol oxidase